jgi:hypothetical protein
VVDRSLTALVLVALVAGFVVWQTERVPVRGEPRRPSP